MGNIYLIRHGFTPTNNVNYNGQGKIRSIAEDKDMPLEREYGVRQALELGTYLNSIEGKTLILASPYNRVRQTLNYALSNMKKNYEIIISDDLHEINSGVSFARTKDEVLEIYPNTSFYEDFKKDPINTSYIEGESNANVRDRVKDISNKIIEYSNKYDNVFVFAHGVVNKWIYYWINNGDVISIQKNCEVIMGNGNNKGKSMFLPVSFVPKGYLINIEDYK